MWTGSNALTYYPGLKHIQQHSAGINSYRYGYDTACVLKENQSTLPEMFTEAVAQPDRLEWMYGITFEFDSLTKVSTWEPVKIPHGRKVIKKRVIVLQKA